MALAADRMIKRRDGEQYSDPVATETQIHTGALVCLDAEGYAVPGSEAADLTARGVCESGVNNQGLAGDAVVSSRAGVFNFKNSAGADEITRADIGDVAMVVDDETVAKSPNAARSVAGEILDVTPDGVWVRVGI